MRAYIALALAASYAAAATTQATCDGFFVGLVKNGWTCTFDATSKKVDTCTKTDLDYAETVCTDDTDDNCEDYLTACMQPTLDSDNNA